MKTQKQEMCPCGCGETIQNCKCPPTCECKTKGLCNKSKKRNY